jgi:hypothetical protein
MFLRYLAILSLFGAVCAFQFNLPSRSVACRASTLQRGPFRHLPALHVSEKENERSLNLFEGAESDNFNVFRKVTYGLLWTSLLYYVFQLSPGGSPQAAEVDGELIKTLVTTPFDGSVPAIFVFLFNSLGIIPAVYASLLLPYSKGQKLPALGFVGSRFVFVFVCVLFTVLIDVYV